MRPWNKRAVLIFAILIALALLWQCGKEVMADQEESHIGDIVAQVIFKGQVLANYRYDLANEDVGIIGGTTDGDGWIFLHNLGDGLWSIRVGECGYVEFLVGEVNSAVALSIDATCDSFVFVPMAQSE